MKDENGSCTWLRHSMSNLSYREACNFNKARGNNPQRLAKRKRDVHSLPCSQCGLLLPSSLQLWSLAERWRELRDWHSAPAQHTVNGIQEHFHHTPDTHGASSRIPQISCLSTSSPSEASGSCAAEVKTTEKTGLTSLVGLQPAATDWGITVRATWKHISKPVWKKTNAEPESNSVRH